MRQIGPGPDVPLFPNRNGQFLSRSGVEKRLQTAVSKAICRCPVLKTKRLSPHTFRHTTAMHLLQSGVDITVIALWLGHESIETTHQYVEASLSMKEQALSKLEEIPTKRLRYRPDDRLLQFLDGL
jgi:site-specific recombinase XerD